MGDSYSWSVQFWSIVEVSPKCECTYAVYRCRCLDLRRIDDVGDRTFDYRWHYDVFAVLRVAFDYYFVPDGYAATQTQAQIRNRHGVNKPDNTFT